MLTLISCKEATTVSECLLEGEVTTQMSKSNDTDSEQTDERICLLPEPSEVSNLVVNAQLRDFDEEEEIKMNRAIERLKIVINSESFRQRILNFEYDGKKEFYDNDGLSNEQIYQRIISGAEALNEVVDNEIDLDLTLYYKNNGTVGYTYKTSERVWVNNKFFKGYTLAKVAKNLSHEWSHKLGFTHSSNRTTQRPYSVPYAVGDIIQELIEQM